MTDRKFPAKKIFMERFFTELPFELVYTPKTIDMDELYIRNQNSLRRELLN